MPNYSYFYIRAVADDNGIVRTEQFQKGDPELLDTRGKVWATHGRYKLLTRQIRGGLSGSGDVLNPAKAIFKRFRSLRCNIAKIDIEIRPSGFYGPLCVYKLG